VEVGNLQLNYHSLGFPFLLIYVSEFTQCYDIARAEPRIVRHVHDGIISSVPSHNVCVDTGCTPPVGEAPLGDDHYFTRKVFGLGEIMLDA
jgi:hypothetical protein